MSILHQFTKNTTLLTVTQSFACSGQQGQVTCIANAHPEKSGSLYCDDGILPVACSQSGLGFFLILSSHIDQSGGLAQTGFLHHPRKGRPSVMSPRERLTEAAFFMRNLASCQNR